MPSGAGNATRKNTALCADEGGEMAGSQSKPRSGSCLIGAGSLGSTHIPWMCAYWCGHLKMKKNDAKLC